jgi:phage FluMu protein gp41
MRPSPRSSELGRRLRASASTDELREMVERQLARLGTSEVPVSLATLSHLSRNAAGRPLEDRRMCMLLVRARDCLADGATRVDPHEHVDIALALANLRAHDALARSVWESMQARYERIEGAFSMRQISQLVWACSKAPVPTGELMSTIAKGAEARVGELTQARDTARIAHAIAKAAVPAPGLLAAIAAPAEQRAGTFNAQDLANTAWAFSTAGVRAPKLFAALEVHTKQRMDTFNPQNLANTARAFATAGVRAPELFAALATHSERHMGTFNAQNLTNTAWAFATAGVRAPELFAALAVHSEQRMGTFNAQNLVTRRGHLRLRACARRSCLLRLRRTLSSAWARSTRRISPTRHGHLRLQACARRGC